MLQQESLRYGLMSRPGRTAIKPVPARRAYDPLALAEPNRGFLNL